MPELNDLRITSVVCPEQLVFSLANGKESVQCLVERMNWTPRALTALTWLRPLSSIYILVNFPLLSLKYLLQNTKDQTVGLELFFLPLLQAFSLQQLSCVSSPVSFVSVTCTDDQIQKKFPPKTIESVVLVLNQWQVSHDGQRTLSPCYLIQTSK